MASSRPIFANTGYLTYSPFLEPCKGSRKKMLASFLIWQMLVPISFAISLEQRVTYLESRLDALEIPSKPIAIAPFHFSTHWAIALLSLFTRSHLSIVPRSTVHVPCILSPRLDNFEAGFARIEQGSLESMFQRWNLRLFHVGANHRLPGKV